MNDIQKLRYWTFKILPLVYDDSLSYYEVLAKVTAKTNELVENVNAIPEAITKEVKEQLSSEELATQIMNGLVNAIATDEDEATYTTQAKEGGEVIWLNGTLYEVVAQMDAGTNYMVGTNIEPIKISDWINEVKGYLTDNNEFYHSRSAKDYDTGVYLYWKDGFYITTKDIKVNDILYNSGDDQNLKEVDLASEVTQHYTEMHEADNNLQTQIDGNDGDIEALQNEDKNLQEQITTNNNTVNTRISNIVAQSGTDNTEIVDARINYWGKAESTLHDRVESDYARNFGMAKKGRYNSTSKEITNLIELPANTCALMSLQYPCDDQPPSINHDYMVLTIQNNNQQSGSMLAIQFAINEDTNGASQLYIRKINVETKTAITDWVELGITHSELKATKGTKVTLYGNAIIKNRIIPASNFSMNDAVLGFCRISNQLVSDLPDSLQPDQPIPIYYNGFYSNADSQTYVTQWVSTIDLKEFYYRQLDLTYPDKFPTVKFNRLPILNTIDQIQSTLNTKETVTFLSKYGNAGLQIFHNVCAVGDSLTAGFTNTGTATISSNTARELGYNWPEYIAQWYGQNLTNVARGSSTVQSWRYGNSGLDVPANAELANVICDAYYLALGVNDARTSLTVGSESDINSTDYTQNANSFYGNYDWLINKLHSFQSTSEYGNYIFCFTIPPHDGNAETYNAAIRTIVAKYNYCILIDLYNLYKTEYTSEPLTTLYHGGHYEPLGYNYIAKMINNAICSYMNNNLSKFLYAPYKNN